MKGLTLVRAARVVGAQPPGSTEREALRDRIAALDEETRRDALRWALERGSRRAAVHALHELLGRRTATGGVA